MPRASLGLLLVFPLALGACGPSAQSVCEASCAQSKACDLGDIDTDKDVEICKATCDAFQLEAEQDVEQGDYTQECLDRNVDYGNCVTSLSCSDVKAADYNGKCAEERSDYENACS